MYQLCFSVNVFLRTKYECVHTIGNNKVCTLYTGEIWWSFFFHVFYPLGSFQLGIKAQIFVQQVFDNPTFG